MRSSHLLGGGSRVGSSDPSPRASREFGAVEHSRHVGACLTYASWRALENQQKLAAHRARGALVVATGQQPGMYLGVERVFELACVPTSAPYRSDRAGLLHVVDASNARAGAKRRPPARQIKLALAVSA